jgi:hypothetical protein
MKSRTIGTLTSAKESRTTQQETSPNAWGNQLEREVAPSPTKKVKGIKGSWTVKPSVVKMERLLSR